MKVVVIALLSIIVGMNSNSSSESCREFLKEYFIRSTGFQKFDDKVLKIEYETYLKYNPELNEKSQSFKTNVFISGNFLYMDCPTVSIYKDSTDLFYVLHSARRVMWYKDQKVFKPADIIMNARALQDSFLNKARAVYCKMETLHGDTMSTVTVDQLPSYVQATKIERAIFKIRTRDMFLASSSIVYSKSNILWEKRIDYKDFNYESHFSFPEHIKALILSDDGKLKDKFRAYTLVDLRHVNKNKEIDNFFK
ncbi:MAG: hypothetical protein JST83_08290 [Bacteroidetes bacterium]|nr:hypothetical protein [Bacteroidota bacterium]